MPQNEHGFDAEKYDAALQELMAKVKPRLPNDPRYSEQWVARFLRARRLDVAKAEQMLVESLAWREKHNADHVLDETPDPRVVRYLPHGFAGRTKEGHQIYIERSGAMCLPGPDVLPMEALFHWKVWMSEKLEAAGREPGSTGKTIAVLDMEGLTLSKMTPNVVSYVKMMGDMEEKNYPESLERVVIVNCGWVFTQVWAMVKYFFAADIRKKIMMLSSDYEAELYKHVARADMPPFLKGTSKNFEGQEWVGDLAYMHTLPQSAAHEGLDEKVTVKSGKQHAVTLRASRGNVLQWGFVSEKKSIEFSVAAPSGMVVEAPTRHDTGDRAVTGSVVAGEEGAYTLLFCNKFSWTTDKTVRYFARVVEAGSED